jgi:hypothetical protein
MSSGCCNPPPDVARPQASHLLVPEQRDEVEPNEDLVALIRRRPEATTHVLSQPIRQVSPTVFDVVAIGLHDIVPACYRLSFSCTSCDRHDDEPALACGLACGVGLTLTVELALSRRRLLPSERRIARRHDRPPVPDTRIGARPSAVSYVESQPQRGCGSRTVSQDDERMKGYSERYGRAAQQRHAANTFLAQACTATAESPRQARVGSHEMVVPAPRARSPMRMAA